MLSCAGLATATAFARGGWPPDQTRPEAAVSTDPAKVAELAIEKVLRSVPQRIWSRCARDALGAEPGERPLVYRVFESLVTPIAAIP